MKKSTVAVAENTGWLSEAPVNDRPTIVSASVLARHIDVSRQFISKLEADNVIDRAGDGFDIDVCRLRYIRHLRRAPKTSARSAADARFQNAKARLIELRVAEREKVLMVTADTMEIIDEMCGLFRTGLSALPVKIAGRSDRQGQQRIESACNDILRQISEKAEQFAQEATGSTATDSRNANADHS